MSDALFADVKRHALETGRTFTAVVEDALRDLLERQRGPRERLRPPLPVFAGGTLRPGVDLDDTASLLDLMDEPAVPS